MSNRCMPRVFDLGAILRIGIGTSSRRGSQNTGSTSNCPRNRGSSLYSIDGWTKGAISACSSAVSSLGKTKKRLPTLVVTVGVMPQVSDRYAASLEMVDYSIACTQL